MISSPLGVYLLKYGLGQYVEVNDIEGTTPELSWHNTTQER